MKKRIVTTILFTVLSILSVFPQHLNTSKLDSLFNILGAKNKAMGSVAISKNGKLLYERAFRYSLIFDTAKTKATTNTKYRIASVTKIFTAAMIFQLIEEGKVTLNTTLDTYFPDIPNATKITISDLLGHRSGLHDFVNDTSYTTWMKEPKTPAEILSLIAGEKPDFQPGTKASYCNTEYLILGYILEKITHQSYAKNLTERITSKLGLSNTYYENGTDRTRGESFSYEYVGKHWKQVPSFNLSFLGGAGAIVSTPADLVKFMDALFSLKLVSQRSLSQMERIKDGFGMGLMRLSFDGPFAYGHGGSIDGFLSALDYFPEDHLTISYCSNGQVYSFKKTVFGIVDICFNNPYTVPTFYEITDPGDLNKYLGVYTCTQNSVRINVSKDSTTLVAQTNQDLPIPLDAVAKDKFSYNQGSIKLDFNTARKELTVIEGERKYLFKKDINTVASISGNTVFGNKEEQINNFTGYIYYLPRHTQKLPDFTKLKPVGKLYAKYLNVPVQDYRNGFPGISDRIEDYAIDYKGKF